MREHGKQGFAHHPRQDGQGDERDPEIEDRKGAQGQDLMELKGDRGGNCESDPGKLGSLSVSFYSPYFMRAIHYVPLGPPAWQPLQAMLKSNSVL